MSRVVWIVTNMVHYHRSRLLPYARRHPDTHLLQLLDRDMGMPVLQADSQEPFSLFGIHTVFPGESQLNGNREQLQTALSESLDSLNPDVVCLNGWGMPGSFASLQWAVQNLRPAVLMSESTQADQRRYVWKEFVKKRFVRACASVLCGGKAHLAYLEKLGFAPDRCFTGYNCVDNAHFEKGAQSARNDADRLRHQLGLPRRYMVASARFEEKKNLIRLVRAFAEYRRHATNAQGNRTDCADLVIVGDGHLREAIELTREQEGVVEQVHLPGLVDYATLPTYYGLADALVHASVVEQWGLVVNEAMAAGLPVLASHSCGCVHDLVEEGRNGYLFDPVDIEDMANTMTRFSMLETETRQRMGDASRQRIAAWGPTAFAAGLEQAVAVARDYGARGPSLWDTALFKQMAARGR